MDTLNDVSILTTIPKPSIEKLLDKFGYCIVNGLAQAVKQGKLEESFDIGIGTLTILNEPDALSYRFVPTKRLERALLDAAETGKNQLIDVLEEGLIRRILTTYKDII